MKEISKEPVPGTYRTLYTKEGVLNGEDDILGDYHSAGTLIDYFKHLPEGSLKNRFFSQNSEIYGKVYRSISPREIVPTLNMLARSVYYAFTESNEEINFLKYQNFFEDLYWCEHLFVSFNFFEDKYEFDDNLDLLDKKKMEEKIQYYRDEGGFDSWVKQTETLDDGNDRFVHLRSGMVFKVKNWRDRFVRVNWFNEYKTDIFVKWFKYTIFYLSELKRMELARNLCLKRVTITGDKSMQNTLNEIYDNIDHINPIFGKKLTGNYAMEASVFLTGQDLELLVFSTYHDIDRRLYELGRVSNTNPKGDRYSTGENYKDITGIARKENITLKNLKLFALECKEKWGIELNFDLAPIPGIAVEQSGLLEQNRTEEDEQ